MNINGRPALRVGDPGMHAACCGPNMWNAKLGSATVFINGKPAHRLNDMVQHCGGMGKLIEGSGDVLIGGPPSASGGSGGGGGGTGDGSAGETSGAGTAGASVESGTAVAGGSGAAPRDGATRSGTDGAAGDSDAVDHGSPPENAVGGEKEPDGWVHVRVLDVFGDPLPNAAVYVRHGDAIVGTGTTDENGDLHVDGLPPAGSYEIEVVHEEVVHGQERPAGEPLPEEDLLAELQNDDIEEFGC